MTYFASSAKFNRLRRYLLIGVVSSLCLSVNTKLGQPALDLLGAKNSGVLALHSKLTETLQRSLTTSIVAHGERPAAVKYRVKRPLAQLAVLTTGNFGLIVVPRSHVLLASGALLADSAFLISQLRGRAPPRLS